MFSLFLKLVCRLSHVDQELRPKLLDACSLERREEGDDLTYAFNIVKELAEVWSHHGTLFQIEFNEAILRDGERSVRGLRSKPLAMQVVNGRDKLPEG